MIDLFQNIPPEWIEKDEEEVENENETVNQEKTDSFWTELNLDDEKFIRGIIKGDY